VGTVVYSFDVFVRGTKKQEDVQNRLLTGEKVRDDDVKSALTCLDPGPSGWGRNEIGRMDMELAENYARYNFFSSMKSDEQKDFLTRGGLLSKDGKQKVEERGKKCFGERHTESVDSALLSLNSMMEKKKCGMDDVFQECMRLIYNNVPSNTTIMDARILLHTLVDLCSRGSLWRDREDFHWVYLSKLERLYGGLCSHRLENYKYRSAMARRGLNVYRLSEYSFLDKEREKILTPGSVSFYCPMFAEAVRRTVMYCTEEYEEKYDRSLRRVGCEYT
jgi:hypothetical protein